MDEDSIILQTLEYTRINSIDNSKTMTILKMHTVVFLLIAAYGSYAFIKRGIGDYIFMKTIFFDLSEPRVWFFLDYLTVMVLFAEVGYWLQRGLAKVRFGK